MRGECRTLGYSQARRLFNLQEKYRRKYYCFPRYLTTFAHCILVLWVIVCCWLIVSSGVNFDRDVTTYPDPMIMTDGTSNCAEGKLIDDVVMSVDIPYESALNLLSANVSANAWNELFKRYPESKIKLYHDSTKESHRFVISAFVAWFLGAVLLTLFLNVCVGLTYAVFPYIINEKLDDLHHKVVFLEDAEKLEKSYFKFLLLFYPWGLITMDLNKEARIIMKIPDLMPLNLTGRNHAL